MCANLRFVITDCRQVRGTQVVVLEMNDSGVVLAIELVRSLLFCHLCEAALWRQCWKVTGALVLSGLHRLHNVVVAPNASLQPPHLAQAVLHAVIAGKV